MALTISPGIPQRAQKALNLLEEDVKYMRDIAERDAINRYTTAEIHIEQNNENHISSNMDLDGVVGYLNDGVEEAVDIATEGGISNGIQLFSWMGCSYRLPPSLSIPKIKNQNKRPLPLSMKGK